MNNASKIAPSLSKANFGFNRMYQFWMSSTNRQAAIPNCAPDGPA